MFRLSLFSLAITAGLSACQLQTGTDTESLAAKCAIVATPTSDVTAGATAPVEAPVEATDCPVCKDADGHLLPPGSCTVHDDVCHVDGGTTTGGVFPTRELQVLEHASQSPAIAYYGACDGSGAQCEKRNFAYQLTGNEIAVATFRGGVTTVYAIPQGQSVVLAKQPIFPLVRADAYYANHGVRVLFVDEQGETEEGFGDIQNDCRVVDESASDDVPCWCTEC